MLQWAAADPSGQAISVGNVLNFFEDDFATGQFEAQSGSVDMIKIYNGVLSDAEVADLENYDDCDPLAVDLQYFLARELSRGPVYVGWGTAAEIDNVGFNVYREPWTEQPSVAPAPGSVPLNTSLVPATGSPFQGARYRWLDGTAVKGQTYSYWLEDVDINGVSTFHGPIAVR